MESHLKNAAAPAPSSLAGGEVRQELIELAIHKAIRDEAGPGLKMLITSRFVKAAASAILAALSPEAPAREGAKAYAGLAAFVDVEVHCEGCAASGPNHNDHAAEAENRAEAVEAWNRRALLSSPDAAPDEAAWIDRELALMAGGKQTLFGSTVVAQAAIDALAAARAREEGLVGARHKAIDRSRLWEIDAIKWENKANALQARLDKAEGLLREANREIEEMEGGLDISDRINAFLTSKEAERG